MPTAQEHTAIARMQAQQDLAGMPGFHSMSRNDQLAVYRNLVDEKYRALAGAGNGHAAPGDAVSSQQAFGTVATGARNVLGALKGPANELVKRLPDFGQKRASDLIDDDRHLNQRIDQAGDLAGQFIDNVDFPKFVRDLLKGVFDANLQVTIQQMEAYQRLLKSATQDIAKFVNAIDNTAAFGYLAENHGDEFSLDIDTDDDGKPKADDNGQPVMALTDKEGNKLASSADIGDNELKARIMDAKIAMAKEQRALLRETILMGITRLVVERGVVKASVLFDIKAGEKIDKADKAALKRAMSHGHSLSGGGGVIGNIFGVPSGGGSTSLSNTQISISSAKSTATTSLEAKLAGSVEIVFKSDYFKLDNFANMYGQGAAGGAAYAPGGGGGGTPAGTPAPAGAPAALPPAT